MNGNNVGIWVEVFFITRLNAPAPPTSALFHFFDQNISYHLKCEIECRLQ